MCKYLPLQHSAAAYCALSLRSRVLEPDLSAQSPYDDVPYGASAHASTHPDRLATIATLFGMAPAPVERCRFLEIACGDAGNLIPMAYELPRSEFVGFDLAARPIEMGERAAARLGLSNVTLSRLDLNDFPPSAGRFDYIVAHGLYSWVPGPVRDRLLALIGAHLAPHGVAFVSYNVYPGCYVRRMLWEMLKFHTDHLDNLVDTFCHQNLPGVGHPRRVTWTIKPSSR